MTRYASIGGTFCCVAGSMDASTPFQDLHAAIADEEVVLGPFFPAKFVEVAFVHKNGAILEYMQYADLDHWFGEPNPIGFQHEPLTE